jgi:hypothetical protein
MPDVATLRAAAWAASALVRVRRQLRRRALTEVRLAPPPRLPASSGRGVEALLRRREHTCLEAALVRQRWLAGQGDARDVIVGVSSPRDFSAHAWLDGDMAPAAGGFQELTRVAP